MIGLAEVRAGPEDVVGVPVVGILRTIVVGDGESHRFGYTAQPPRESCAHFVRSLLRKFGQAGVAGLALDRDLEGLGAAPGDRRVGFPMPDPVAGKDRRGTLADRYSVGNMSFLMPAGVSPVLASTLGADEERDEMPCVGVDPLVNGFMADGQIGMPDLKATGSEFGRPALSDAAFDISADKVVLETLVSSALAGPSVRPGLGFVGQVVSGPDGRGVALELPAESSGVTVKGTGDSPKGLPLAFEYGNEITLINGQVFVGFQYHPRILTRKTSEPLSVALRY